MAGTIVPLILRKTFDFSGLGSSRSQEFVMVRAVEIAPWTQAVLQVRVYARTIGASASIEVRAVRTCPDPGDPSLDFVDTGTSAAVVVSGTGTTPYLETVGLGPVAAGGAIQISVKGIQPSSTTSILAVLGAELVVKSAG